jgi:ribulose-5-phosphate 4-epimerase/fuculose-1-phosphate aldolase
MTKIASTEQDAARLKLQVAACSRMLVMEGLLDYSGHVAARAPGRDAFYIQPGAAPRNSIAPDGLLLVDFEGRVLAPEGRSGEAGRPPVEIPIHIEIFRARPDVLAVLHCHMELAIAFTMMQGVQLVPMRARAVRWESGIPTDPDPSHIKTTEQGRHLADTLGRHNAALMRAHGMVIVAESVPALLVDAVHFDENARALLTVLQAGARPIPLTADERVQVNRHEMRDFHVPKLWSYFTDKAKSSGVLPRDWPL